MVDDRLRAHPQAMAQGVARLERGVAELADHLAALDRGLDQMCSLWSGAAQQAYARQRELWRSAADDMARTLDALRAILATAHANYGAAEAANLRMWGAR